MLIWSLWPGGNMGWAAALDLVMLALMTSVVALHRMPARNSDVTIST